MGGDTEFIGYEQLSSKKYKSNNDAVSDDEKEDIYSHVELGPYGLDGGGKLDFREEDEDYGNLGDYGM